MAPPPEASDAGPGTDRPRLLVASLRSGTGKTLVTAGILGASRRRGWRVAPFKCGPDFLDPQILTTAAGGVPARNLDLWMASPSEVRRNFIERSKMGLRSVNLIEGVMGLWDTRSWGTSSWDVARLLRAPVILVVDGGSSAESVAAEVRGARSLARSGVLCGVLVNRAGDGWHARAIRDSIERWGGLRVFGLLPYEPRVRIPERHLGLVTPVSERRREVESAIRYASRWVEAHVDIASLLKVAEEAPPLPGEARALTRPSGAGGCLAVASDEAFSFIYPENLDAVRQRGARVIPFSPLRDDPIPPAATAVYLPGGYPELRATDLERSRFVTQDIREWARDGRPLYAECGGMMVLLERLVEGYGEAHKMAGIFPGDTRMTSRLQGFGYVEARVLRSCLLGPRGTAVRGHIFHHSVRHCPSPQSYTLRVVPRSGGSSLRDGLAQGQTFASYVHLRFESAPRLLEALTRPGLEPVPPAGSWNFSGEEEREPPGAEATRS